MANLAADSAAALDLDLAIGNLPRDSTRRPHDQPLSHDEIPLKRTLHIGFFGRAFPVEDASLLDDDVGAIGQFCFDFAFNDQPIAGGDLALDRYPRPDDQRPKIGFGTVRARLRLGFVVWRRRICGPGRFGCFPKGLCGLYRLSAGLVRRFGICPSLTG